ncbi:MAG: hypothetical protein M0Z82_18340 [Actinomycetota bacterium]|jgi:hypothetical protein|nr:hypothetical protein [Actinomycetota bacterium]
MRRLLWMGVGAAGAVSGRRWLSRAWRQALERRAPSGALVGDPSRRGQPRTLGAGQSYGARPTPSRFSGPARAGEVVERDPAWLAGAGRTAVAAGAGRAAVGGTERSTDALLGAAGDVVGAAGALAGRAASRLVRVGVRAAGRRVQWAVEGGRADARRREHELRRSLGGPGTGRQASDR